MLGEGTVNPGDYQYVVGEGLVPSRDDNAKFVPGIPGRPHVGPYVVAAGERDYAAVFRTSVPSALFVARYSMVTSEASPSAPIVKIIDEVRPAFSPVGS